jgi:hypothetical protein
MAWGGAEACRQRHGATSKRGSSNIADPNGVPIASKRITNIVLMRIEWREMILAMATIDVTDL